MTGPKPGQGVTKPWMKRLSQEPAVDARGGKVSGVFPDVIAELLAGFSKATGLSVEGTARRILKVELLGILQNRVAQVAIVRKRGQQSATIARARKIAAAVTALEGVLEAADPRDLDYFRTWHDAQLRCVTKQVPTFDGTRTGVAQLLDVVEDRARVLGEETPVLGRP